MPIISAWRENGNEVSAKNQQLAKVKKWKVLWSRSSAWKLANASNDGAIWRLLASGADTSAFYLRQSDEIQTHPLLFTATDAYEERASERAQTVSHWPYYLSGLCQLPIYQHYWYDGSAWICFRASEAGWWWAGSSTDKLRGREARRGRIALCKRQLSACDETKIPDLKLNIV